MPKVTYVEHNGRVHVVDAEVGMSVMESAVKNTVPGIDADCGGACACATCHVLVDDVWLSLLPPPSETEQSMLDFVTEAAPNSRLACQIRLTAALDGLRVRLPASQH